MKLFFTIAFSLIMTSLFSQSTVNYQVQIVEFRITGCDDGFGADEEPSWKAWGRDDINTTLIGGTCFQQDANSPFTHNAGNTPLISQTNTLATAIDIKMEAWEDDNVSSADRCTYDSGDDCYENLIFPSIVFQNDPHCQWNSYVLTSGSFTVVVRINWEYSTFSGGVNISDCGTTVPLSAQGSGSWSVYNGTNGSFVDVNDPVTNFSGGLGTYTLLWSSLPGCINIYQPDTVLVDFVATPNPSLTASATTICEGNPVTFTAQNGTLYDWSLNTNGNVVLSDGSGQYSLTPSLTDNMVYVSVSNGTCAGLDSISFTVNASPNPTITNAGGVLSTQTYAAYQWYFNGSPISGGNSSTYTPTQPGSYYVEVVSSNGCSAQSSPESVTGINELSLSLDIYPNPTSGVINFDSDKPIDFATVYNTIGQVQTVNFSNNKLDLSKLPNGIYIVSISIENHVITKRIILSK